MYLNIEISDSLPIHKGVPQGSIVGPLLFSCYANELPLYLDHCRLQMYADDVQIYRGSDDNTLHTAVCEVNHDIREVYKWAKANGLCFNPRKSKCLVIPERTTNLNSDASIILKEERI